MSVKRNVRFLRSEVGVSLSECFSVEAEMYGMTPRMTVVMWFTSLERSLISSRVFTRSLYCSWSAEILSLPLIMLDRMVAMPFTLMRRKRMGNTMARPKR